jgi:ketosteroid isomerase-like protein
MSLEQTIQRLQDRVDIQEMMFAYCRHADQLDIDGMVAQFTEDCVVTYVPKEVPPFRGKDALRGFLSEYFPHSVSSSHYMTNVEMRFDSADAATVFCYMYSWQRFKTHPAAADCHRFGRYEIRAVRAAGAWRMSHMTLLTAGEYGGTRLCEQFDRPFPPAFA